MRFVFALLWGTGMLAAQNWEVGVMGGGGFDLNRPTIKGSTLSAEASMGKGLAVGGFLKQNLYDHLSGEIRYLYRRGDMQLSGNGLKATFGAESHTLQYEFQVYAKPREAKIRPFLAAGAGFRYYRGTGAETVSQPLSSVALLTKTSEWKPVASIGGGVTFNLSHWVNLSLACRDYVNPFPKKVIAPITGTTPGWLHDLTPMIELSFRF